MDLIELQIESETLFHRNQLMVRLRKEFGECEEAMARADSLGIDRAFAVDLLCKIALYKQCDVKTMVGLLRHHAYGLVEDRSLAAQVVADAIHACIDAELVGWNQEKRTLVLLFDIDDETKLEMARYQFPLPMVLPPQELKSNRDTGHYHFKSGSVLLNDSHHDDDACLDHLNRMNRIPLRLDWESATHVKNAWKGLDKPREDDQPGDFEKRKRAFEKYDAHAHDVFDRLCLMSGEFWLTHAVDFRGRTYCRGYYVSYQGNAWNKASIMFAEEEVCV